MKKWFCSLLVLILLTASIAVCRAEETAPMYEFDLDAYWMAGGMLRVTYEDGMEEETGCYSLCMDQTGAETTVGDILSDCGIAAVEPVCEGDVFEGWMIFELSITEDEDGFSDYTYISVSDELYTTEELMALPAADYYAVYAAKWESIPAEDYFAEDAGEEIVIRIPAATLYANEGVMLLHGEEENYESSMHVAAMDAGQTLEDVLELNQLLSITRDGYTFAGWMVYEVAEMENMEGIPEDAEELPCFEVYDGWYCVLRDYRVISECMDTDELKTLVCGEQDLFICAIWE